MLRPWTCRGSAPITNENDDDEGGAVYVPPPGSVGPLAPRENRGFLHVLAVRMPLGPKDLAVR